MTSLLFGDNEHAVKLLQQMIRIRTSQPEGNELDLAHFIMGLFDSDKIEKRLLNHTKNRASLLLKIHGETHENPRAIIGHLDTIGVDNAIAWDKTPYGAILESNKIFGRGSANAKGALTSILLALKKIEANDITLPRDTLICLTADADLNAFGARTIVDGGFLDNVSEIVFANPTNSQICIAEKGAMWLKATIKCHSIHSNLSNDKNNGANVFYELQKRIFDLFKNENYHKLLGKPTCTITNLNAVSNAHYCTPNLVEGVLDLRFSPFTQAEQIIDGLNPICDKLKFDKHISDIAIETLNHRPAVGMDPDSPLIRKIEKLPSFNKKKAKNVGINYFTDASIVIPKLGVPFAILGPGKDIYANPLRDEYIDISSVSNVAKLYLEYLLCGD